MGCFSGPDKVEVSDSERELANLANEKYQYSRRLLDPLRARDRAEADRLGLKGVRQLTVNRAVNTAREQIPKSELNPNQKNRLRLVTNRNAETLAKSAAAGESTADAIQVGAKTRNLATGLRLSLGASQGSRQVAAQEAGYNAARSAADSYVKESGYQAAGQAIGTAGTVLGYKKGWFDNKTPATGGTT